MVFASVRQPLDQVRSTPITGRIRCQWGRKLNRAMISATMKTISIATRMASICGALQNNLTLVVPHRSADANAALGLSRRYRDNRLADAADRAGHAVAAG